MIARIWRGWATHANADAYETLVRTEIIPGIMARNVAGFREIELLRLVRPGETEFVSIMWFDDLDAVRAFAGEDHEKAVVPLKARELLRRFDARSEHYELRESGTGSGGSVQDGMIARLCLAGTTHTNADAFEALVRDEIFPGIAARNLRGLREARLLRLARPAQTEFLMIEWFDDLDSARLFAGEDYEKALFPSKARDLLRRIDARSEHYEVRDVIKA